MAEQTQPVPSDVKCPQLYASLRQLLQHVLTVLPIALSQPEKWPVREATRVVFPSENTSDLATYSVPNIEGVLAQIYSDLESSQPYVKVKQELATAIADDPMARALGIDMSFLFPLLTTFLRSLSDLQFDEGKFRVVHGQLEEYIASGFAILRAYWELKGLSGDLSEVRLSPTHRIYRLDEAEVNRIWTIMAPREIPAILGAYFPFRYWPLPGTYLLSVDIKCLKKDVTRVSTLLFDEETRISTALRLSSTGAGTIQLLTCEELTFMPRGGHASFLDQNKPGAFSYRLDPTQNSVLTEQWPPAYELACELQDHPDDVPLHLQVGASRYSSSFEKTTNEDRLIDSAIALEALYTKENDALSYRLPLRAAVFTGDVPEEREHIFQLLKAAYDLRSKLAHGQKRLEETAKLGGKKIPIVDFVERVRSVLLKSLHRFMQIRKKIDKEEILTAIDKAIISMDRTAILRLYE